jgi:uncharacterized protein YqgV (UPF0045/DUF77 family)
LTSSSLKQNYYFSTLSSTAAGILYKTINMQEENNVNLSLQIIPINTADAYPAIDEAIYAVQRSGVKYEVQAFATLMEGPLPKLLQVVEDAKNAALSAGAEELVLNIQVHLKKDRDVALEEKTKKFK